MGLTIGIRKKLLFSGMAFALVMGLSYGVAVLWRTVMFYRASKHFTMWWEGRTYQHDKVLGYSAIKSSTGLLCYPEGLRTFVGYDIYGFRRTIDEPVDRVLKRPLILTLGCSHTWGHPLVAEDTFAHKIAERMHGSSLNAALGGYGLSQALILARDLVPKYKPDYVIVQWSAWMGDRSIKVFAPVSYGLCPTPYFTKSKDFSSVLAMPVFMPIVYDIPVARYVKSNVSVSDFVSFAWNVGAPLYLHDDYNVVKYNLSFAAKRIPPPVRHDEMGIVVNDVYNEISGLCKANGSKMIILVLGVSNHKDKVPYTSEISSIKNAVVVDGLAYLYSNLDDKTEESYAKAYATWGGEPLHIIDDHPNVRAHELIAEAVVSAIEKGSPSFGLANNVREEAKSNSVR